MGTWGSGPFDHDAAGDLLVELREGGAARGLGRALRAVARAKPGAYLDVDDGGAAWAAAELVALSFGQEGSRPIDDSVFECLERLKPSESQRRLALEALPRLLDRDHSELAQLWHEGEDGPSWDAELEALGARLEAAAAGPRPRPRLVAGDLVLVPTDGGAHALVHVVGAREVAVYEGLVADEDEARRAVGARPARRLPSSVPSLMRSGRPIGPAKLPKALAGRCWYGVEAGAIDDYLLMTASGGGARPADYAEASAVERLRGCDVDALVAAAEGRLPIERVRSPDVREAELRSENAAAWEGRRQSSHPGPFGDLEALGGLLDWIEAFGIENAIARMEDTAAGRIGYGRPSEPSERRPWAFVGLVAHWRGHPERAPWPDALAGRLPPAPSEPWLARAVAAARQLVAQVETRDAALRLIWGEALTEHVARAAAALE